MNHIQLRTPAKLNLFLHITGRRADGYHELQSIFRAINLFDTLNITRTDSGTITRSIGPEDIPEEQDLVVKAARLLKRYVQTEKHRDPATLGCDIQLHKHIPTGAGMGGGSSNAAGVLIALNQLWQLDLLDSELQSLASQLGADVAFFIWGGDQWAEGIGDCLQPVKLAEQHFVVLYPNVHCPTAELFAQTELRRDCGRIQPENYQFDQTENVFEPVALRLHPEIAEAKRWLHQNAGNARLTGSGSALFAIVANPHIAMTIQALCPQPWRAFFACSLGNRS